MKALDIAKIAHATLDDKKAKDIVLLDVSKLSGITDYFLIATGNSTPQLKAMFNDVQRALKEKGVPCYRRSGTPESGWLTLDYFDIILHIFSAETRAYYSIESLWEAAPTVPL
jgi:ribosome-associated protein